MKIVHGLLLNTLIYLQGQVQRRHRALPLSAIIQRQVPTVGIGDLPGQHQPDTCAGIDKLIPPSRVCLAPGLKQPLCSILQTHLP